MTENMQHMLDFIVGLLQASGNVIMSEPFIYILAIIILFIVLDIIRAFRRG